MKSILFFISLLTCNLAYSGMTHVPLDISFEESQELWKNHKIDKERPTHPSVARAISGGEILGKWLKAINQNRRSDNQLRLTSGASRGAGIPIDRPSKYGPKTIDIKLKEILSSAPIELLAVIYQNAPMTNTNPIADVLFIEHGRKISRVYQSAVRWETVVKKWLPYYTQNQRRDIRGYYYLTKIENLDQKLIDYNSLPLKEKQAIKGHLHKVCVNSKFMSSLCKKSLDKAIKKNKLLSFKNEHWIKAKANWDSFWLIKNPRKDVQWNSKTPNTMKVTFKDPKNDRIANWLKENIEDEFKTDTWQMEFNLINSAPGVAYLKFKPGVTPHVSGGNVIVMDANSSIQEYSVKWTIRHEYGHILRIPDCYVEFYDEVEELAVNYQLDVTDLMCSRSGDFNERLYKELKRVYFKK
jgi:hypothetical protein